MGRYLLSIKELADVLGRHPSSVHTMIRNGRLPLEVIENMGIRQVRRADVEAFLGCPLDERQAS